jgi:hypothetical protein
MCGKGFRLLGIDFDIPDNLLRDAQLEGESVNASQVQ